MSNRRYYSERHGRHPGQPRLSFDDVKRAAKVSLLHFEAEGYFQEHLGHFCVDSGFSPGLVGGDTETEIVLALGKTNLWPLHSSIDAWNEDDLFDMVEFLYAHASKPTERHFHSWDNCGWHCTRFDRREGRTEFRQAMNRLLGAYDSGFELSNDGEVVANAPTGLDELVDAPIVHVDNANVSDRVASALHKFRHHRASVADRRDAVRDLADVLEFLRPDLKRALSSQDEKDLFNIANNFGIRHHRPDQHTAYDQDIWLDWIFYYYLATLHAATRLIEKNEA